MDCNSVAYEGMDDKEVMAAFQQGDVGAYIELYDRFEQRIGKFLKGFENGFSGPVRVEDIVQHTFMKLFTHGHRYKEGKSRFNTWLYTIAGNLARTELRKTKRRKTDSLEGLWEHGEHNFSVDDELYGGDVRIELESREYVGVGMQRLERFVDEHPVFGTVLLLRGQGLEYKTIADIMNIPVGTVKSRINRGRAYLRDGYY